MFAANNIFGKVDKAAEIERYRQLAERVRPLVVESVSYLHKKLAEGKKILVEGANADILTAPYALCDVHAQRRDGGVSASGRGDLPW